MVKASLANLSAEEISKRMDKENELIRGLEAQIEPLEKKRRLALERLGKLQEQEARNNSSDLRYVITHTAAWNQWQEMLPKQTFGDGYWAETGEQAFKLMFIKDDEPSKELIEFIKKWLAVVKLPRMNVFRYDLCERGQWHVELMDGIWKVYNSRDYGHRYRNEYEMSSTDLVEVLRYVSKHHYYQRKDGRSHPDDDDDDY